MSTGSWMEQAEQSVVNGAWQIRPLAEVLEAAGLPSPEEFQELQERLAKLEAEVQQAGPPEGEEDESPEAGQEEDEGEEDEEPDEDEDEGEEGEDDYDDKTVAELKELLEDRGLTTSGNKADLIERLREDDAE